MWGIIGDDHHDNDYEEERRCLDDVTNLAGTRGTGLWDTLRVKIIIIVGGTIIEVNINIKIVLSNNDCVLFKSTLGQPLSRRGSWRMPEIPTAKCNQLRHFQIVCDGDLHHHYVVFITIIINIIITPVGTS